MEKQIQTFVFFDLETTGLLGGIEPVKITEMALVAVARESVHKNSQNSLPRVLHKLILPINPKKIIPSRVEYMTKLFNDDMHLLQPFEVGIYELIICFLNRLKPPICFVAHNGDNFDYPIFISELSCINKILDNTILCIDTLKMFKDYFKPNNISNTAKEIEDLLDDGYNESLSTILDSVMEKTVVQNVASTCSLQKFPYEDKYNNRNDAYEKHNTIDNSLPNYSKNENHRTPSQKTKQQDTANKPSKNSYKRRLEFDCEKKSPVNYKLPSIYEYMFNSNFDSHSAEADCIAMLRCVTEVADYFLTWSDNKASPLAHCKKI